ncbi:hypothetical protein [Sphingobacterium mizutaii]|uniref:hypothetical protein n=1 Tax=Sphingobacterium mizutaii TaxID=1010 RepID=UPI003D98CC2B
MDSNANQLAPINFDEGYVLGQQPHEMGQRASTFIEFSKWLNVRLDLQGAELIDPTAPGTAASPAVIPPGPEDRKGKFEPAPGFYQGFPEVKEGSRYYFYWDKTNWTLWDLGPMPVSPATKVVEKGNTEIIESGGVYDTLEPIMNIPLKIEIELYNSDGSYTANGNVSLSNNWISTKIQIITDQEEKIYIKGFQNSGSKNIRFFNPGDTNHQNPTLLAIPSGVDEWEFIKPSGFTSYIVNVARGTNVGADVPNSQYQSSFELYIGGKQKFKTESISKSDRIETDQLHALERIASETIKYLVGNGAPGYMYGLDNIEYLDISTGRIYRKQNNLWDSGQTPENFEIEFTYPELFTYRPTSIYRQRNGIYQPKGFENNTTFVQNDILSMLPAFVDCVNGLDTNTGSIDSPFKSINKAVTDGYRLIICREGIYDRNTGLIDLVDSDSRLLPLIILPYKKESVIFFSGDHANFFNWTVDENVFRTARTNVKSIIDSKIENPKTGFFEFKQCATLAECKITSKSWFTDNANIWVNTGGASAPDISIKVIMNMTIGTFTPQVSIPYYYLDSFNVYIDCVRGGIAVRSNTVTQFDTKAYLKNIGSYLNKSGNGLSFESIKFAFTQNCGAYGCMKDAHNYHTSYFGMEKMKFIEINGWSLNTGKEFTAESSSNGSTSHDGIHGIRFGGSFDTARGGIVIDVNPDTKTLNFVAQAKNPIIPTGSTAAFQAQDGAIQWNYGIYAKGRRALTGEPGPTEGSLTGTVYVDKSSIIDGEILGNVIIMES